VKKSSIYYWTASLILALIGLLYWLIVWKDIAWTDDAYVHGNQIYLTPLHSGFVTAIHTDDTFFVKEGQVLVELDRTDAEIAIDREKEELALAVRRVCEMFHQVFAYRAEIEMIKAKFIRDAQDFDHRLRVLSAQAVSLEDYEHAVASLRESYHLLQNTQSLYEKSLSLVQNTTLRTHPLILAAADRLRDAWVYLHRCNLFAPSDGIAAQRTIQVGMWVKEGTPLMSVVPTNQIWVNANFKETQMKRMRIGQRARIKVDLYGRDMTYHGKIVGLPAVAGNVTGLLPPQNLSGNWIKIVQRLPVRIELELDELKTHPLRLGLSCEVTVDLENEKGAYYATSPKGSPTYATSVFDHEEKGDLPYIEEIIGANLDPTLNRYNFQPLHMQAVQMTIPSLIQEALLTNPSDLLQPPEPKVENVSGAK
jgi:membrane fusion protein (multidrug efflux system)